MLAGISIQAAATDHEFRSMCALQHATDTRLDVRVVSGRDACRNTMCYASIYEAVVLETLAKGQSEALISFTTSAPIALGQTYTLFAEEIGEDRSIVYMGDGLETTYTVPADVRYYVPIDGAFIKVGGDHYRTVWRLCTGDVAECRIARHLPREISVAEVLSDKMIEDCPDTTD